MLLARDLHSVGLTVRISVPKITEKGVFKVKIRMSAFLEKRVFFGQNNSQQSEKRVLI